MTLHLNNLFKDILSVLLLILISTSCIAQQPKQFNRTVKRQIHRMAKDDQKWRNRITKINSTDSLEAKKVQHGIRETDSLHYFAVNSIFRQYGFANYDLVGQVGSMEFWLLVQHQDAHPQFQDSVLQAMKIEVDSGKANGTLYAYLLDRVNINTGKLQVYGTQLRLNADSTSYEVFSVEDPEQLNARRASVGLGPIEGYIQQMNKEYLKPKS